ncbi:lipopolysaccharide biosynthesis protein [Sinorhizobium sp. BG8]|uniref:lipopolysaccharide biosynthesis protein n=1 Tax=Sinorhizobium sp. BG8 TaxID=2613773 RepID=UPI001FED522B|nr:lipopolysaccharide biosynthesis protein [Sinorhizobium sp. BG8]
MSHRIDNARSSWQIEKGSIERIKSILHLLTGNFASSFIGLAGFALTARALGPADYGMLALCFSYSRAIERLVAFRSWQPLIKFGSHALHTNAMADFKALLKFGLALDAGAALLAWAVAIVLLLFAAPYLGISSQTAHFAIIYCSVLPFQITGMPTAVLRLFGRFHIMAYGQVTASIIRVLLCLAGVLLGGGLYEFLLIWMGSQIIGSLCTTTLAFIELHRRGIKGVLTAPLRGIASRFPDIWKFSISSNFSLAIRSSAFEVDTLLVGFLADPASAGLFHIAKRIGKIAQQAGLQVQAVLYPDLSKAWAAGDYTDFRKIVGQTQLILLAFGVASLAFLYATIDQVLLWTAGASFLAAGSLVMVQAIAVTLNLCTQILHSALLSMGLASYILRNVLMATAAFHLTAITLVPEIGAMGANIAHIVMGAISLITMTYTYRKYFSDRAI